MEKVGKEICLDSDVLIDLINGDKSILNWFQDYKISITSISSFEFALGNITTEEANELLAPFNILSLNKKESILAADIFKKLNKKALGLDFRDIMIASICISNNVSLLTKNFKHFERLKEYGLKLFEGGKDK